MAGYHIKRKKRINNLLKAVIFLSFFIIDADYRSSYAQAKTPSQLVQLWQKENNLCRGLSDPKVVDVSCNARDVYSRKLREQNWCYGKKGQTGSQMEWHKCDATSNR